MTEEKENPPIKEIPGKLPINQATMDILVANIIPTSRYFEIRFDHLEDRVNRMQNDITDFRSEMTDRFQQVDDRFQRVDKRFDDMKADVDKRFDDMKADVDKRFDQVDKRFDQMITSIDRLTDKLDHRDERQRNFTIRMFTISITISVIGVAGAFLKTLGLIEPRLLLTV